MLRILSILFIMVAVVCAAKQDTLIVSFGDDWPPYYSRQIDGTYFGLDIDLIREIFREAHIPVKMIALPTARGHEYLKSGAVDFLTSASFTEKRNEYAAFSLAYRNETVGIMIRSTDKGRYPMKQLNDIGKFAGATIAYQRGGWYGPQFELVAGDLNLAHHLYETKGIESRLKMLANGRVTMVIDDYYALATTARALSLYKELTFHPLKASDEPIHLMFSRKSMNESTVKQINQAIVKLTKNGSLSRILKRWGR